MPADIAFTQHAVERFIQRHARELSYETALARLQQAPAFRLRERTLLGQLQYEIHDPYCVLVVKRDRQSTPELVCVTVLPTRENSSGWTADEEAIRNEWLADQAAAKARASLSAGPAMVSAPAQGAFAAPKPAAPPAMPKDPEAREFMLKSMALIVEKEREKTRRHELSEQLNGVATKRCIRILLIDLVRRSAEGDESARAIAELVQEVRPEFLQSDFLRIGTEKEGTES